MQAEASRQQGRAGSQGRPPEASRAATAEGAVDQVAADAAVVPARVGQSGPSDVSASPSSCIVMPPFQARVGD